MNILTNKGKINPIKSINQKRHTFNLSKIINLGPTSILIFFLIFAFIIRYVEVMHRLDMGHDIANYLLTMQQVFGHDPAGFGLQRPPLIALPLKLFTLIFGTLNGAKILGVLISVSIAIPFYLIARRLTSKWIAIIITIGFLFWPAYTELLSWSYITLIGIFLFLFTIYFLILVLDKPSKINLLLSGVFLSLLVGFHQVSFTFLVLLLLIYCFSMFLFNRKIFPIFFKHLIYILIIGVILSIPYLSIYIHMLQTINISSSGDNSIFVAPLSLFSQLRNNIPFTISSWLLVVLGIIAVIFIVSGISIIWQKNRSRAILLSVMIAFPSIITFIILPDPLINLSWRAHYFLYIPIFLSLGIFLSWFYSNRLIKLQKIWRGTVVFLLLGYLFLPIFFEITVSQRILHSNLEYSSYLDDNRWEAINWITNNTDPDANIAVYPYPLGWWVAAESLRNDLELGNRDKIPNTSDKLRSLIVDNILSRNQGLENGNIRLANSYPYKNAPGNPVLSVYTGGRYQDILLLDDNRNCVIPKVGEILFFKDATDTQQSIVGNNDSMKTLTYYQMNNIQLFQTTTLNIGENSATISYDISDNDSIINNINIPIIFSCEPLSVLIGPDNKYFEIQQIMKGDFQNSALITYRVNIAVDGANITKIESQNDQMVMSFELENNNASITFSLNIITPDLSVTKPVNYYSVPQILKDNNIDYIVIDLKDYSYLWNGIQDDTQLWFNICPYYKLVYSNGDIRIYKVLNK